MLDLSVNIYTVANALLSMIKHTSEDVTPVLREDKTSMPNRIYKLVRMCRNV